MKILSFSVTGLTSRGWRRIIDVEAHFKSSEVFVNADGLVPIGQLARRTGVATSALRYYERIGLLSAAARAGGRRHYEESSAERVALIRLYQDAGFTLAEIGRLLAAGSRERRRWTQLAEHKIAELDARIADAQQAKKLIEHALKCTHRDLLTCPNFRAALEDHVEHPP